MPRGRRPRKEKEPAVPVTFAISADVETVMGRVIRLYPVQFSWCANFKIAGVMASGGRPKDEGGCVILARFVKVPPLWHGLTGYDAVVRIEDWAWGRLDASGQEALVTHELCHGSMSDRGTLRVLKHDLDEFGFVVKTYGAWRDSIAIFDKQLSLFEPGLGREGGKLAEPQELPLVHPAGSGNGAAATAATEPAAGDPVLVGDKRFRFVTRLADGSLSLKRSDGVPRQVTLDPVPLAWDSQAGAWRAGSAPA